MSQLDRRQAMRMIAALGAAGALAPAMSACSTGSDGSDGAGAGGPVTGDPVTVGIVAPQTGARQALGAEILNGFQLYLNGSGNRLGGRHVNLLPVDEGDTVDSARAAVERLVRDEARVLTGISNAEALSAVKDAVEAGQVPLVTPSPSLVGLQGAKYVWRTGFVTDEPGRALAGWVAEHAEGPVFVMAGEGPGARDDVRGFVTALRAAGGSVAGEPVYVNPGSRDFQSQLNAVRAPSVGALFCLYGGAAGVEAVKQLKNAGLPRTLQIYGPGQLTEGTQLAEQGDAANGIYTAMNYAADLSSTGNLRFVADYQKVYGGTPSAAAVASYDAAAILDQAILTAAEDSPLEINNAIGRLGQIESPRGTWQFNQNRSPLQKWYLRQVKVDGKVLANVLTAELVTLG